MSKQTEMASCAAIKTNDKAEEDFRVYDESSPARVVQHYKDMRMNQTVDFYRKMEKKYSFEDGACRCMMTIEEAFVELEHYVVSFPQWLALWLFLFTKLECRPRMHLIQIWSSPTNCICFRLPKGFADKVILTGSS